MKRQLVKVEQVKEQFKDPAKFPEDVEKMKQESSQVLIAQQMLEYRQLVEEYRDIFSTKNEPLGKTDVVLHDIKTIGDPIKQQYGRIPEERSS